MKQFISYPLCSLRHGNRTAGKIIEIIHFKKENKMTKLDISAYGVQELNHQEMVETEGGLIGVILAVTALVALAGTVVVGCNETVRKSVSC